MLAEIYLLYIIFFVFPTLFWMNSSLILPFLRVVMEFPDANMKQDKVMWTWLLPLPLLSSIRFQPLSSVVLRSLVSLLLLRFDSLLGICFRCFCWNAFLRCDSFHVVVFLLIFELISFVMSFKFGVTNVLPMPTLSYWCKYMYYPQFCNVLLLFFYLFFVCLCVYFVGLFTRNPFFSTFLESLQLSSLDLCIFFPQMSKWTTLWSSSTLT